MKIRNIKFPLFLVISVLFTVFLVLISGVLGVISYKTSKDSINNISEKYVDSAINKIIDQLHGFLELPQKINDINYSLVGYDDFKLNDIQALEQSFFSQIRSFDTLSSIYFGNTDGGLILAGRDDNGDQLYTISTEDFKAGAFNKYRVDQKNNKKELLLSLPNFDARTRAWYQEAVLKGTKTWSDIYILFTGQDMAIAAAQPVYTTHGDLAGVLSIDLFLSHIQKFLKRSKISESGSVFIIDKEGYLIASSTDDLPLIKDSSSNSVRRMLATEIQDPIISHVAKNMGEISEETQRRIEMGNDTVISYFYPFKDQFGIDWIVVAAIPEKDFMKDVWRNNQLLILIIILAAIISIVFGFIASNLVVSPVRVLNLSTARLIEEGWKPQKTSFFIKEIDGLNSTFNTMAIQLTDTLKNLKTEVADRKKAEEAMEDSVKEILKINKKLENYSYTISHDLKEPIRSIRTFSQFIKDDYAEVLDEEGKDFLTRIIRASTRMALMIDDLLLLSKIGQVDINFEEVSISKVIDEINETFKYSYPNVEFKISYGMIPVVICQPVWIKTLFNNLISNSIKYSDKSMTEIKITCIENADFYEFSIEDNGQGIENDQYEKIFGLFRKAHQNKDIEGSGAGLAIVSSVIEQHNGRVWVDKSVLGEGTVIKFTISKNLTNK